MRILAAILGIIAILTAALLLSSDRRAIPLKAIFWGIALQFAIALMVLKIEAGRATIDAIGRGINWVLQFSYAGSTFMFGSLGAPSTDSKAFFFAFQVLPNIIFASALIAIFHHYGITKFLTRQFARAMRLFIPASGAESLNVAATVFLGQTEAPLTIRSFLPAMTRSELMTVMTSGMAHVSGGMIAAYATLGINAGHLLTAVLMTAPGSVLMAKMIVPERETPATNYVPNTTAAQWGGERSANLLSAIVRGTTDGVRLALGVGAMLIVFIALVELANGALSLAHRDLSPAVAHLLPPDIQTAFGVVFAPVAWLIGVPWVDCTAVGNLLGTRMILNELVAFTELEQMRNAIDPRSFSIATFALCGFANLSSIGIQIGGIGALAPGKIDTLASLGWRAMLGATMANLLSACISGLVL